MRKKLLTILLSIALILTSTVMVFAEDLGDYPTIAEILETVDGGFPKLEYSIIPENAWVNSDGNQLFLNATNDQLLTDAGGSFDTRYGAKKSNNDYIWSLAGITITFFMDNNNELSSIKFDGLPDPYNGTYTAPSKTIASILATVDNGFPTTESNGWKNEKLKSIFLNESKTKLLLDDGESSIETSIETSKVNNDYTYSLLPGTKITFIMDDNSKLSGVNYDGLPGERYVDYNGTYTAPTTTEYTVTYNANGATSGTIPANQTKTAGVDLTLASKGDLEKTGYKLIGWNTQADGKGTHYEIGATYKTDADLDLYAEWIDEGTKKVCQILPEDFPTSRESSTWTNKSDTIALYKDDNNFYYRDKEAQIGSPLLSLMQNATPCDEGYQCSNISDTLTFTFHMNGEKLVKIEITGDSSLAGVYAPIPEVKQLYEVLQLSENVFPTSGESSIWTNKSGTIALYKDDNNFYYRDKEAQIGSPLLSLMQNVTPCEGGYQCSTITDTLTFIFHINGGILTSIDIAGNDPLVGTYSPIPASITIEDILGTVDGGFPTTKDYGWINEKGKRLYVGNNLIINGNESVGISTILTLTDDNTYTYNGNSIWTFNMNNGVLKSVVVSDYGDDKDGTYVPATFISEVSFEYEDFDFSNLSFAPAKAPDGAKYEVVGSELILLKNGEIKYYYQEGVWHDEDTREIVTPKLSEIDKAAAAVGIKTSGKNTFDSLTVEVTADNKDGSSQVLTRLQDVSGAKNGEGFERYNDQTLICCLLFDVPVIKEVSFTYGDFNFNSYTFNNPTLPTGAKYNPADQTELLLLLGSEVVACSPDNGTHWYEYYDKTIPINNIKEEVFDSINFALVINSDYGFYSDVTVKANNVELSPIAPEDIVTGKNEGYYLNETANFLATCVRIKDKYIIAEGNKAKINKDAIKDTVFKSNADFSKFIEVRVDGKIITKDEDYTAESGSTKVTLYKSFLSNLALGEHTLAIISKDGQASTAFTITRNPSPNPGYIVPNTGVE